MAFIIFILAICIFLLFNNFNKLKTESTFIKLIIEKYSEETAALKKEIAELKKALDGKIITSETNISSIESIKPQEIEFTPEPIPEIVIEDYKPYFTPITDEEMLQKTASIKETEQINSSQNINKEEPILSFDNQATPKAVKQVVFEENLKQVQIESAFSKFMKTAEKQFADNWTGILGTAIMVLGIGYLSIYTALKVAPIFRVLILWLYAGLLVGSYYILQKKEKWTTTGLWLRSAGASLFLFGCFGASQIPALTFITNSIAGYSLIGLGIALNLYVGYIIKNQTFLSLHVVLSILILCVIPEKSLATIVVATITATIGIILSYKEKWEYHLLIVITSFIIFDIWFNAQGTKLSATENIIAILGIIAVAASCMFMQYRKVYENTFFDKAAFITHLTNWILFATGLILHATGSRFKTFVLFIGALICFFIALKARKKKVIWLYHLDVMVAFILLDLSIIMLNDWNVGIDIIACILYLLVVVCLFLVYKEKEVLLHKIFLGINHVAAIALVLFLVFMTSNSMVFSSITNGLVTTIILSTIAILVPIYVEIKKEFQEIDSFFGEKSISLNGILALVFSIFVVVKSNDSLSHNLFVIVLFGIAFIWSFLQKKYKTNTFSIGRIVFYVLSIFIAIFIIKIQDKSYLDFVFSVGLLAVIVYNWIDRLFFKNDFIIRFIGIIGVNALLLLLVYKYLPQHQIIQIFSLFTIALLNHEFLWLNFKKDNLTKENQSTLYIFYYFFTIIGSLLFLYHSFDFSNTEITLTCLGISAIEIYVLFAKRIKNNFEETTTEWTNFNLLNSELLLFNILLFGFSCLQLNYVSLFFMATSILMLLAFQKYDEFKRFNLYSLLTALLAIIVSLFYSFDKLNNFNLIDWILQLSSIALGLVLTLLLNKKEQSESMKTNYQIVLNAWLSLLMFSQLPHKWLPVFWAATAILNLYLYHKKISKQKNISIVYYLLANLHLGFLSFNYYESKFLVIYLLIFILLSVYIYLAYKWLEEFSLKNSLLIYPATLSIGCFLYLTFDKGILTFFWILEALGLLILGIALKEKYFRYVSLSLVGLCVVRLMFFDLSNADFLIRALVLLGVGVVLLIMNSLFKKYKDRFE